MTESSAAVLYVMLLWKVKPTQMLQVTYEKERFHLKCSKRVTKVSIGKHDELVERKPL